MDSLLSGISACIGLQLVMGCAILLYRSSNKEKILAILSFILSLSFLQLAFQQYVAESLALKLLFAGKKFVLIAPLLYIYISYETLNRLTIRNHFIFPMAYILGFYLIQFGATHTYLKFRPLFQIFNFFFLGLYLLFYFYFGHIRIKRELGQSLRLKILNKYKKFYYTFNLIELFILFTLGTVLVMEAFYPEEIAISYFSTTRFFGYFSFIWGTFVLFFLLSESDILKTMSFYAFGASP